MAARSQNRSAESFDAIFEAADKSRDMHNGMTEAIRIMSHDLPRYVELPNYVGETKEERIQEAAKVISNELYEPFLSDEDFTLESFEKFTDDVIANGRGVDLVEKISAYCALSTKAYMDGRENFSWSLVAEASYWLGIVVASKRPRVSNKPGAALAWLRHQRTREEITKIEDYWIKNVDHKISAQKAADKILMSNITDLSHKKVAEVISRLRKREALRKE
jgi:hypothetical protein